LEKHSVSRLSYLFSHLQLLSSYSFSSTRLSSNLSLLSASSLLCFSSVQIVGSLTSKLPSKIWGGACSNFYKENDPKGQGLTVFFCFWYDFDTFSSLRCALVIRILLHLRARFTSVRLASRSEIHNCQIMFCALRLGTGSRRLAIHIMA
jgi:hypothetical protein